MQLLPPPPSGPRLSEGVGSAAFLPTPFGQAVGSVCQAASILGSPDLPYLHTLRFALASSTGFDKRV